MRDVVHYCDFQVGRGRSAKDCGKKVEEPTTFSFRRRAYEIDLCSEHLGKLEEALAPILRIARPAKVEAVTGRRTNGRGRLVMKGKGGSPFTAKDVRDWLADQGRPVHPSGRISDADIEAFKAAQPV